MTKHHIFPFPKSTSHATTKFELTHMDLWGPYKYPTISGATFFLTILDDQTRSTWTFLFHSKSQVPTLIKHFIKYVQTQFQVSIKTIRTDNGTEFVQQFCDELFKSLGIVHQRTVLGRPRQNGRVERKHRHL